MMLVLSWMAVNSGAFNSEMSKSLSSGNLAISDRSFFACKSRRNPALVWILSVAEVSVLQFCSGWTI